ncbi:MAG: hypothetical protein LBE53_00615 [Paucimonas sp.]|jgi:hypothetical protein|uniref:hypothetical protein n=1 Tax=Pantoea sp. Cy-639 TaxID=2608360 RepID=UPI0014229692|nr:hypothetical protein [Pantoea sp. Cy-639]MDR2305696.1 hypothetical protein [Paucimonas sp.]NIF15824.1 hypothetical protein [Pantoea sp. Cy-639]
MTCWTFWRMPKVSPAVSSIARWIGRHDIVVWNVGTAYRFDRARFATFRESIQRDLLAWSRSALQELPLGR